MPDCLSQDERALIEAHLRERGVTRCATGAMATVPEYRWEAKGKNRDVGRIVAVEHADGEGASWRGQKGSWFKMRARAARLRKAEGAA